MKENKIKQNKKRIENLLKKYDNNSLKYSLNSNNNKLYCNKKRSTENIIVTFKKYIFVVENGIIKNILSEHNYKRIGYFRNIKTFHSNLYKLQQEDNYIHSLNNLKHCTTCEKDFISMPFRQVVGYLKTILGQYTTKKIR